ncbi:hypothetical protein Vafri_3389 [Volvox africanus]|uniref:FAD-binding domain-containing protein n=1 Tax=Volvox africanus TaxID=51714 RepID=A0A8J4ARW3_9CHLO|nr:hypothetical protein Vafri_3389 [Volvox africanus]
MGAVPRAADIAIIGGGLGGLALAAGLCRRGLSAHVFEASPQLRQETSTMIGLGPNGFVALGDLHPDLPGEIRRRGVAARGSKTMYLAPGQEPLMINQGASEVNLVTIRWAKTQEVLAQLVPPEFIHCDHVATGYDEIWDEQPTREDEQDERMASGSGAAAAAASESPQTPGGGSLPYGHPPAPQLPAPAAVAPAPAAAVSPASHAIVHFLNKPSVTARLVVAADGVFSAIRSAMHPNDPGPRYLGHMNWNCLLCNPGGNSVAYAHEPGEVVLATDGQLESEGAYPNLVVMLSDAGGDHTFWQVRMQYDEPCFTSQLNPPPPPPPELTENAADGGGGGGGGGEGSEVDVWRGRGGLGVPGSKARVLERLEAAGFHWVIPVVEATPESAIFERALYDRAPLERWASEGSRVVLLGDAAHGMHPMLGQGARSAFEDAHQLMLAVEALWPDVPAAVERYQQRRVHRANRVQAFSAEAAGLSEIREAARPPGAAFKDRWERWREFNHWINQYPTNMDGDPNSKWWKPPPPPLPAVETDTAKTTAEVAAAVAAAVVVVVVDDDDDDGGGGGGCGKVDSA